MARVAREEVKRILSKRIASALPAALEKEAADRAKGVILFDGELARLIVPPWSGEVANISEVPEEVLSTEFAKMSPLEGGEARMAVFFTGKTSYLTARRMWGAYQEACDLVSGFNYHDDEALLYELFHFVPGTSAIVERGDLNLVGVRSHKVGIHQGMLSFPGGLAKPGESISGTGKRELLEETGLNGTPAGSGVMVRHPDAPSISSAYRYEVAETEEVKPTFEAKGKKYIWVSREDHLLPALDGNMRPIVFEFRRQGTHVPDELKFALDTLEHARRIYHHLLFV